jgi:hypothetical protein
MNNKGKRLNRVILRGDVYWNWENENGIVRPIPKIIDDNNAPVVRTTKVDIVFNDEVIYTHTYNQLDKLPDVGELLPAGYVYIDPKYKIQKYVYNKFIVVYDYYDVIIHYLDGSNPGNTTQFGEFRQRYKYGTVVNKDMIKWPEGKRLDTEWFDFVVGYRTSARIINKYMYFSNATNDTYSWGVAPTNLRSPTTYEYVDLSFPSVKNTVTTPFPQFGDGDGGSYYTLVRGDMLTFRDTLFQYFIQNSIFGYDNSPGNTTSGEFRGKVNTWSIKSTNRTLKKYDDEYLYESKHHSLDAEVIMNNEAYWPFILTICTDGYDKAPITNNGDTTYRMYAKIGHNELHSQLYTEYITDYINKLLNVYPMDIEKLPESMSEKDYVEYYFNNVDKFVHSIKDKYNHNTLSTLSKLYTYMSYQNVYVYTTHQPAYINRYLCKYDYDKNHWIYGRYYRILSITLTSDVRSLAIDVTIGGVTKKLVVDHYYLYSHPYICVLLEKNGKIYKFFYQAITLSDVNLTVDELLSIFPDNDPNGTPLKTNTTVVRIKKLVKTPQEDISWNDILKMNSSVVNKSNWINLKTVPWQTDADIESNLAVPNDIPGIYADNTQKEILKNTRTYIETYIIETRTAGAEAGPSVNLTRYKVYYTDENGNRKDLETDLYLMSGESVINALDYPKRYQLKSGFTPVVEPYDSKNGWYPVRVEIERTLNSAVIKLALVNPDNHTHEDWNNRIDRPGIEINTPMKVLDGTVMTVDMIKDYVLASSYNREWFTKTEEVQPIGLFHKDGTPVENEAIYDDVEYVLQFKLIKSDIIYHEISLLDRVKKYMWLNGNAADIDFCLAAFWVKADNVYNQTEHEFKNGKRLRNDIFEPFTPTSPAKNSMYYAINDNYELAKGATVTFDIIRNGIVIHTVEDYPLEKLFGTNALKNPIKLPNSRQAYSEYMINNLYYILTANMTDIDLKEAYLKAGINFYGLGEHPQETGPDEHVMVFDTGYIPKNEMDITVRLGWSGDLLSKGVIRDNIPYKLVIDFIPTMLLPFVSGDDFKEPDDKCKLIIKNFIYVPGRYKTWEESEPHNTGKNIILRLLTDNELTDDGQLALFYKNPNNLNYGSGAIREINYMFTSIVSGGTRGFFTRMHQARFMCYTLIPVICTLRHFGTFGPVQKTLGVSYLDKNDKPHDYWLINNERYRQTIGFNENIQWENNGLVYTAYTDQSDYTFLSETILKVGDEIFKNAWRRWNFPTYGVTSKEDWYRVMKKFLGTTIDEAAIGYDIHSFPYKFLGANHTWDIIESLAYRQGDNNPFRDTNLQFDSGDRVLYVNTEDFASTTPTNTNATMNGWRINNQKIPRTFVQHIRSNAVHNAQYITKAYFIPSGTKWDKRYDQVNQRPGSGASLIAYNQRNPMYRIIDNITSFNDLNKRVFWRHVFASVYNAYMSQITTGNEAANSSFYTMTRCITTEVYSYDNVNYKKYASIAGAVANARFVCMMNPNMLETIQRSDLITVYIPKGLNSRYMGYVEK